MNNDFKFVVPAEFSKSDDGEWIIEGLASTESVDRQGEKIIQAGIDLTPIDQGKGWLNNNHLPGIENLLGTLDSYRKTPQGLVIKGRLFKNKEKARAVYEVMSSLNKAGDKGRIGLSVEGKVLKRSANNSKVIEKCRIDKVAITISPVNTDTWATLAKSLDVEGEDLIKSIVGSEIEFDCTEENYSAQDPVAQETKAFSAAEVVELVAKALSVGAGSAEAPATRSGGDALAIEELDEKPKRVDVPEEPKAKKLKQPSKDLFKSHVAEILDKVCLLYPANSREQVWIAVKDRLSKKFPSLNENSN